MIDSVKLSKDIFIPETYLRPGLWHSYILKDGLGYPRSSLQQRLVLLLS